MRTLFILFALLLTSIDSTKAQAIYLDSLRTAVSTSVGVVSSEELTGFGYGASITTSKGLNIGLALSQSTFEGVNSGDGTANGIQFYLSSQILNEIKGDNFGVEFGILAQRNKFEDLSEKSTVDQFGISLISSKKLKTEYNSVFLQFGATGIPVQFVDIVDSDASEGKVTEEGFILLNGAVSFVIDISKRSKIVIEPGFGYSTSIKASSISLSVAFIL